MTLFQHWRRTSVLLNSFLSDESTGLKVDSGRWRPGAHRPEVMGSVADCHFNLKSLQGGAADGSKELFVSWRVSLRNSSRLVGLRCHVLVK